MKKTETVALNIGHQEPQKAYDKLKEFMKSKDREDVEVWWTTTPVLVGANQGLGQTMVITTCLVLWHCTPEQKLSYENQQKLLIKGNGLSS